MVSVATSDELSVRDVIRHLETKPRPSGWIALLQNLDFRLRSDMLRYSQQEFARRFAEQVAKISFRETKLHLGRTPVSYAQGVVASYWQEHLVYDGTPEKYASEDALLWSEEPTALGSMDGCPRRFG